jgi:hypothetical protein
MEIQRADSRRRRRTVALVTAGALVGAILVLAFEFFRPILVQWIMQDPAQVLTRSTQVMSLLVALTLAPLIALAFYLWSFANKIIQSKRFPPPGFAVLRDTLVVNGERACHRGHLLQILAACLVIAALALFTLFWHLIR